MKEMHFNFDLNDERLEEIQDRYAFLEPLPDEYLSYEERNEHSERGFSNPLFHAPIFSNSQQMHQRKATICIGAER